MLKLQTTQLIYDEQATLLRRERPGLKFAKMSVHPLQGCFIYAPSQRVPG